MSAASNALSIIDSAQPQRFEIRPFSGAVGAEIVGLDLARPVNAEDFARIHRAHLDHHVLVFRDQRISPDQQIAFSRRFGPLQIHVLKQFLLAGHPEILIVSNIIENGQNIGLGDAGKFWHSDLSYKELPALAPCCMPRNCPVKAAIPCSPTCTKPGTPYPQPCATWSRAAVPLTPTPPVTPRPSSKATGARP